MKILFLDFDGVLNGERFLHTQQLSPLRPAFDPACCARVERICETTGASIVISSSWREIKTYDGNLEVSREPRPIEEIVEWLRDAGITAPVVGATSIAPMRFDVATRRSSQIQAWVYDHPEVTNWIVLDDYRLTELMKSRFIRTRTETGITDADVVLAIMLLGRMAT